MTEQQGTVESQAQEGQDSPQWRVEGADSSGDGLGDTVVRIPKITDDSAPPKPAPTPRQRSGRGGRTGGRKGADAGPEEVTASLPKVTDAEPKASEPAEKAAEQKPAEPKGDAKPSASAKAQDMETTVTAPSKPSPFAPPSAGGQDASTTSPVMPFSAAAAAAPTLPPAPFGTPKSYGPGAGEPTTALRTGPVLPASPVTASKPSGLRRTRKARLRLSKVDPWSVMKTSFLFSVAFGIMFWVAMWVLWTVVTNSGLFDAINSAMVNLINSPNATSTFRIEDYINGSKVLGVSALLAAVNVVISTALGTLTAFLYNLSANILGGLELTLAED